MALLTRTNERNTPAGTRQGAQQQAHPQSLRQEIDRLFDDFFYGTAAHRPWSGRTMGFSSGTRSFVPTIDLSETENDLRVSAELPGLTENDIHLDVDDETITLSGEKHEEQEEESGGRHWREISYGSFQREIPLPCRVDTSRVKATFKNGTLRVSLPKSEEDKARRRTVPITAG